MTIAVFVFSLLGAMALGMPIAYALLVCGLSLMAYMASNGMITRSTARFWRSALWTGRTISHCLRCRFSCWPVNS